MKYFLITVFLTLTLTMTKKNFLPEGRKYFKLANNLKILKPPKIQTLSLADVDVLFKRSQGLAWVHESNLEF
jgi:hypothetical protein